MENHFCDALGRQILQEFLTPVQDPFSGHAKLVKLNSPATAK